MNSAEAFRLLRENIQGQTSEMKEQLRSLRRDVWKFRKAQHELTKMEVQLHGGSDPRIHSVCEIVAKHFSVPVDAFFTTMRTERISIPRQIAMAKAYEMGLGSLNGVGIFFKRDHGTVIHAIKKVANLNEAKDYWSIGIQEKLKLISEEIEAKIKDKQ